MTFPNPLSRPMLLLSMLAASLFCLNGASGAPVESPPSITLRQAVHGRFLIGTAVMSRELQNPRLAAFVAAQFDCLTGENEFKPAALEPAPGLFRFGPADKIVAFAQAHGMKVIGHNLCWHSQTPAWMYQDNAGNPLPREQALANLKRHIDTVVGHFRGRVLGWDVVNEALSDAPGKYLRNSPARRAIGDDYILQAFRFAHAADPAAQLYYNDYGNENPDKLKKNLQLIRELQANHIPLAGVGIQSHFGLAYPEAIERLDNAITAYAATGVKVMLTELDVDVLPRQSFGADVGSTERQGSNPYVHGLPSKVAQEQADYYAKVFGVVLKHPGVVTRVTLWGIHDGASWLNNWPVRGRTNYPLLWDRELKPKPAFDAVVRVLTQEPSDASTPRDP